MKQIKLFSILLLITAMAISCKKDDDPINTDVLLVTKIITTDVEGQKITALYEYKGTKIEKITETSDWGTTVYTYTYTGDDISKIVQRNEDGLVKSQSFIHGGGKLLMWTENYETDADVCADCETLVTAIVSYNTDGSQTVKYYTAGSDVVQKQVEVTKSISNFSDIIMSNATVITEIGSDGSQKAVAISARIINPHQNITGWAQLERIDPSMYTAYKPVAYSGNTGENYRATFGQVISGFPSEMTARDFANSSNIRFTKEYSYNRALTSKDYQNF